MEDFPQCNVCRRVQQDLRGLTPEEMGRFMDALSAVVDGPRKIPISTQIWMLELLDHHRQREGKRPQRGEVLLRMHQSGHRTVLLSHMSETKRGETLVAMPVDDTVRLLMEMEELEAKVNVMGWMPQRERGEVLRKMDPEASSPILQKATWMSEDEKAAVKKASVLMKIIEEDEDKVHGNGHDDDDDNYNTNKHIRALKTMTQDDAADTMTTLIAMGCGDKAVALLNHMSDRYALMQRMKCSCDKHLYTSSTDAEDALLCPARMSGMCTDCALEAKRQLIRDTQPIVLASEEEV